MGHGILFGASTEVAATGGAWSYKAISGTKTYSISQESYEGKFGTKPVLKATGSGNNRFYVIALSNFPLLSDTWFYWYSDDYDLSDYSSLTSVSFGTGKANTATMINKWNTDSGSTSTNYIFSRLQSEYSNGWFLPSANEWACCASSLGITTDNYSSTFGLSGYYWTSSLYLPEWAYTIQFYRTGIVGTRRSYVGGTY